MLILSGIVWAALKRRARALAVAKSIRVENGGSISQEDRFPEISRINMANDGRRLGTLPRKGVGALFSTVEDASVGSLESGRGSRASRKFLVGIVEWCLGILLYAGLVQEYNSSVYMRLWVHQSFPFAEFVLNYYAFTTIATVIMIVIFSALLQQRRRS